MIKDLVIISIDSLRADGINYVRDLIYNDNVRTLKTLNLDKFVKQGRVFLNAYSTNTYTTSAHASLFTGEYPPTHGIRAFFDFNQRLNPKCKTLAEELNERGFQTFFYSDVKELFSEMDIWRGFKIKTYGRLNWLWSSIEDFKKERNFIFIHLFDVHEPYLYIEDRSEDRKINEDYYDVISKIRRKISLKSKIDQRKRPHDAWQEIRKLAIKEGMDHKKLLAEYYYKGIEKFDRIRFPKIIEMLEALGFKRDKTAYILLSDHGEGRTEFKNSLNFAHGGELTEETLRIFLSLLLPNTLWKDSIDRRLFSLAFIKDLVFHLFFNKREKYDYFIIQNEKYIYSETLAYTIKEVPHLVDADHSGIVDFGKVTEKDYILSNRAFISKRRKILLKNQPEKINTLFREKDLADLIEKSYKFIFGRTPDKEGLETYLRNLENKVINTKEFITILLNSEEKKMKPFINIYLKDKLKDIENNEVNIFDFKQVLDSLIRFSTNNKYSFKDISPYLDY